VQGIVPDFVLSFFEGMKVITRKNPMGVPTTSITGSFKDQAYLNGMINMQYENRSSILLVEHISDNSYFR